MVSDRNDDNYARSATEVSVDPSTVTIREALPGDRDALLDIWLRSVRATHTFLTEDDIRSLATRLFDSIEAGDVDAVADCYGPDLVVWHNFDGLEQSRADNLKTLAGLIERIVDPQESVVTFPGRR